MRLDPHEVGRRDLYWLTAFVATMAIALCIMGSIKPQPLNVAARSSAWQKGHDLGRW